MSSRLRRIHSDQSGFNLPELITATFIGMIVLMAAFLLLDRTVSVSSEVAGRQDAVQRGRQAMETMTRTLRSQVCLGEKTEPITAATDKSVSFYANLSTDPDSADLRVLTWDATAKTIVEGTYDGSGTYPDLTFPTTPTRSRRLLESVDQMVESGVTQPIFRYYTFKVGGAPGELQQLSTPLVTTDLPRVVMVKIAFFAKPAEKVTKAIDSTSLQSDVYVRIADPTRPTEGPRCL
jgi:Tfp pilus assembly protein PilV